MADTNTNQFSKIIGMKDIYIANVIQNDTTGYKTDKPIKFAPAMGAKITTKSNIVNFYGDDTIQQSISSLSEVNLELDVACLSLEQIAMLYGQKIDKNGVLLDNGNDMGTSVAIGFRSKLSDGKYQFTWLYICNFAGEANTYATIADKMKGEDLTLKGTVIPRLSDSQWRARATSDSLYLKGQASEDAMASYWFTNVYESNSIVQAPTQDYVEPNIASIGTN